MNTHRQPSVLFIVALTACLVASAVAVLTGSVLSGSIGCLMVAAIGVELSTAATRAFRTIWYGFAILLCTVMTLGLLRRVTG